LELTPHRGFQTSYFNDAAGARVSAAPGSSFVVVDLTLGNGTPAPAPLAATFFRLGTAAGLLYPGSISTGRYPSGCPQNASVSPGAVTTCAVLSEIPRAATASSIGYQQTDGGFVTRTISVAACTTCGSDCVDLQTNPDHCGACNKPVGRGTCVNGAAVCPTGTTACGGTCADTSTDPNNCGGCGVVATSGMTCVNGVRTCNNSTSTSPKIACLQACVSADTAERCGACNRDCTRVGSNSCYQSGTSGDYFCRATPTVPTSCAAACGPLRCRKAVVSYQCSGYMLIFSNTACSQVFAASAVDSMTGLTCTLINAECDCV
jgi:hypothetical protein